MLELSETLSLAPLLAITLIFLYKWSSTSTENSPPSPPKLPILGNLHQLGLHPHRSLRHLAQIHGPLMLLHFGSNPVLVVSSAEGAREIMKTHDLSFSNRPKTFVFEKLLYNFRDVASAPYGEYWRQMKSLCVLNLLSYKRVRSFRSVREEEVNSMIEKIKESSSTSSVVNMSETFATLTNDVTSRVALGRKYNTGGEGLNDLLEEFVKLIGHINIGDFIPWLAWLNRMNGLDARLDRVARQFDEFLERVIQEHVSSSESRTNGHARTENDKKDFVDVLLEIQKENSLGFPLERVSIKALILDMFAAGTETTYTFLEWALSELLRNPMVMSKLQKEIRGIVGDKKDITEDDLTGMHYLKAVIKETFRLHPPAPLLVPRLSTREVKINGYNIKANTQVTVNAWHIGRDPNTYKELDFVNKLPFARNRIVEAYFWSLGVCFEPKYRLPRETICKALGLLTMIDDTFDTYGKLDELELFAEAVERWDLSAMDSLPDYMKIIYEAVLNTYTEIEAELAKEGNSYRIEYLVEGMQCQVRAYLKEAKWYHLKCTPKTYDEYMRVGLITSGMFLVEAAVIVPVAGAISTRDSLESLFRDPNNKIVYASNILGRLLNDIRSHKHEQKRGNDFSAIQCYMKEHCVTEEEALIELNKQVNDAWKDVNEVLLQPPTTVPRPILLLCLNLLRVTDVIYKNDDGYTNGGVVLKDYITSLLVEPAPM